MLARIANMKIDPEELLAKANTSGLVIYLFGDDLKGKMIHPDANSSPFRSIFSTHRVQHLTEYSCQESHSRQKY